MSFLISCLDVFKSSFYRVYVIPMLLFNELQYVDSGIKLDNK